MTVRPTVAKSDLPDVSTNSDFNFFLYQLLDYINTGSDKSITSTINGVNYTNNPFFDCSISTLQMTEYLEPVSPDLKATVFNPFENAAYCRPLLDATRPPRNTFNCERVPTQVSPQQFTSHQGSSNNTYRACVAPTLSKTPSFSGP